MKRSLVLVPAFALAVFGTLLALNVINFEEGLAGETSQIDRWTMIFSFGAAAMCLGLAGSDVSSDDDEDTPASRAAAARRLDEGRPDPTDLPSKPGSLLKKQAAPAEVTIEDPEISAPAPEAVEPSETNPQATRAHQPVIDPVDAELQSLIDEDQRQEINELVAAAGTDPDLDDEETSEIVPGSDSVEPLARLELRLADYDDDDLKRVVKESESVVITEMVRSGQLTSEGELTQKDIASMIFLAYTSDEMLTELRLRKSLDETSSGQAGLEASTGSDFAPLKNIE